MSKIRNGLLIVLLILSALFIWVGCESETKKQEESQPQELIVQFDDKTGVCSWNSIDGAEFYEVIHISETLEATSYRVQTTQYKFTVIYAGSGTIRVIAYNASEKEICIGEIKYDLKSPIGAPEPVTSLSVNGEEVSWSAVEGVSGYKLRIADSSDTVIETHDLAETKFVLDLPAGYYTIRVVATNSSGVESEAKSVVYVKAGETQTGSEMQVDGEDGVYYTAVNFDHADHEGFLSLVGDVSNYKFDSEAGTISYKSIDMKQVGVRYSLPSAIDWMSVYEMKVKFRGPAVMNLIDEDGYTALVYLNATWWGSVSKVESIGDGWYLSTVTPDLVASMIEDANQSKDITFPGGYCDKVTGILFSSSGPSDLCEIDYVAYSLRTPVDGLSLKMNGEEFEKEYKDTYKFDWNALTVSDGQANYNARYTLKNGEGKEVSFEGRNVLPAGEYTFSAELVGIYKGNVTVSFTVTETQSALPSPVTGLTFDSETKELSWNAVADAAGYNIRLYYAYGASSLLYEAIEETNKVLSDLPAGRLTISVSAVNGQGEEGPETNVNYLNTATIGFGEYNESLGGNEILNFEQEDYLNFLTPGAGITYRTENNALIFNMQGPRLGGIEYILPNSIETDKMWKLVVKSRGNTGLYLYDEYGNFAKVRLYSGNSGFGVSEFKTQDGWNITTFTMESISKIYENGDITWVDRTCEKIEKIYLWSEDTLECAISSIAVVEREEITKDLYFLYEGKNADEWNFSTGDELNWKNLSVTDGTDQYSDFDYKLQNEAGQIISTEGIIQLAAGKYTVTGKLAGRYRGTVEIAEFTVKPALDGVSGLIFDLESKTLSWDAMSGATGYQVLYTYELAGNYEYIVAESTTETQFVFDEIPGGQVRFIVRAIDGEGVLGQRSEVAVETTKVPEGFGEENAELGGKELIDFSDAYGGFMTYNGNGTLKIENGVMDFTPTEAWAFSGATFMFPSSISFDELYSIQIRFKGKATIVLRTERGVDIDIVIYATWNSDGVESVEEDGEWSIATLTHTSLTEKRNGSWIKTFLEKGDKITGISFGTSDMAAPNVQIDYVVYQTFINVDGGTVVYDGQTLSEWNPTGATYIDITKFKALVNGQSYDIVFTIYDAEDKIVDFTGGYLPAGEYRFEAEFAGQYSGNIEDANFTVSAAPDPVESLYYDHETGKLTWEYSDDATYKIKVIDSYGQEEKYTTSEQEYLLDLAAGIYEIRVSAIAASGTEGTPSILSQIKIRGEAKYNEYSEAAGGYTIIDFDTQDYLPFLTSEVGLTPSIESGVLKYTAETVTSDWGAQVVYELPEPLMWSEVGALQIRFKGTNVGLRLKAQNDRTASVYLIGWEPRIANMITFADGYSYVTITPETMKNQVGGEWTECESIKEIAFYVGDNQVTGEEVEIDYLSYTKKGEYGTEMADGGKVIANFDSAEERSSWIGRNETLAVSDGSLNYTTTSNSSWQLFALYTLPEKIDYEDLGSFVIKWKGGIRVWLFDDTSRGFETNTSWADTKFYDIYINDSTRYIDIRPENLVNSTVTDSEGWNYTTIHKSWIDAYVAQNSSKFQNGAFVSITRIGFGATNGTTESPVENKIDWVYLYPDATIDAGSQSGTVMHSFDNSTEGFVAAEGTVSASDGILTISGLYGEFAYRKVWNLTDSSQIKIRYKAGNETCDLSQCYVILLSAEHSNNVGKIEINLKDGTDVGDGWKELTIKNEVPEWYQSNGAPVFIESLGEIQFRNANQTDVLLIDEVVLY